MMVMGSVMMMPDGRTLWAWAHGTVPEGLIVAEDGAGVSVLKKPMGGGEGEGTMVFVNGIGQSWIPFGGIHSALGALPALLHPKPESIAIIGLGSGDTLFSAAAREETREMVCVEIVGAAMETLREMGATSEYAGLRMLLGDERIRHETGDGRLHLMATEERYDLIEADALRPTSAHSGHLYSEGYFRLLLSRLKRGGLAVTWAPTERVRDTFVAVFPHVVSVPPMLIGSNEAIPWDVPVLRRRMNDGVVRERFAVAGLDLLGLLLPVLSSEAPVAFYGPEFDRGKLKALNTDLFPRDELELPALWGVSDGRYFW